MWVAKTDCKLLRAEFAPKTHTHILVCLACVNFRHDPKDRAVLAIMNSGQVGKVGG